MMCNSNSLYSQYIKYNNQSREKQYRSKPAKQNAALKYQQTEISKQDWDAMVINLTGEDK